jgi:hypothetical protein
LQGFWVRFLKLIFLTKDFNDFKISVGGAADRSGLIHVNDEVIEVNNINVEGKTPSEVLTILVRTLKIFLKTALIQN